MLTKIEYKQLDAALQAMEVTSISEKSFIHLNTVRELIKRFCIGFYPKEDFDGNMIPKKDIERAAREFIIKLKKKTISTATASL